MRFAIDSNIEGHGVSSFFAALLRIDAVQPSGFLGGEFRTVWQSAGTCADQASTTSTTA